MLAFTAAPSLTVADDVGSIRGSLSTGDRTDDTNLAVTVSLAGTGALAGDTLQLYNGLTVLGSGYTLLAADITTGSKSLPTGSLSDGITYAINAKLARAPNIDSPASQTVSVTVDTTPPNVSITASATMLAVGGTTTITFQLSENSSDFTLPDVTSSGGTFSGFGGFDDEYTATFTLTAGSTAAGRIRVEAGKFSDAAGNVNLASNSLTISVDASPPTVAIVSDKTALKVGEAANLTFTLSEASTLTADVVTALGGVISNFAQTSTTVYKALLTPSPSFEGPGTVQILADRFKDLFGNFNKASNQVTLTIDTLPPAPPTAPLLLADDDSGEKGDSLTNVTQPRFSGIATAGLPVTLVATAPDGTTTDRGTAVADQNGNWTIQSAALGNGEWKIYAVGVDPAGNRSPLSPETKLTINSVVLGQPVIALASTDDTGVSNVDGVTNKTTPTFLGTAAAGTTVEVFRRAQLASVPESLGTAAVNEQGQWLLPFGAAVVPFTDGLYIITAKVTDKAGNVSGDATLPTGLTIDTKAPTLLSLAAAQTADNEPVGEVDVVFNEEVFRLEAKDFELSVTMNGIRRAISLAGTAMVDPDPSGPGSPDWLVSNLQGVTGASGTYSLALNQARLTSGKSLATDLAGNLIVAAGRPVTWTTDTTAPRVTMTARPSDSPATASSPWNTGVSHVDIVFDEGVTGVDAGDFTLVRDGTAISLATATVTGSGASWQLGNLGSLTATDGAYTLTLKAAASGITDTAGTGNKLLTDGATSWRIDRTSPTATLEAVSPNVRATPVNSIRLTFSEPVTGVSLADFTLRQGGVVVPLGGASLSPDTDQTDSIPSATYVLSGLVGLTAKAGSYELSFDRDAGNKVFDAAGNQMTANPAAVSWTVDTSKPLANFTPPAPSLRRTPVTTVPLAFTMPVSGVDVADFRLTRNGEPVELTSVSGSGASYTLSIAADDTSRDGVYSLRLVAAGSGITATAAPNNPLDADATTSWTMDATPPTVTWSLAGRRVTQAGTITTVRALFSETVTGFAVPADVTVVGGTAGNLRNGSLVGRIYLFDVTPTTTNPITVEVPAGAASDAAGNPSVASPVLRIVNDLTPPTVVLTAPAITNQNPFTITATFSEPVTGLTQASVQVTNGTATVAGAGNSWSIKVAPTTVGDVTVSLKAGAAKDFSDNLSIASNTVRVTFDNVQPTVTLANLSGSPTNAGTILVAATFTEAVTGVAPDDLAVTVNAKVVGVTGSGSKYIFQVQPGADGGVEFLVPANKAIDAAGNGNVASNSLSVTSDRTPPRVVTMTGPASGVVSITFSEQVRGFDLTDLLLWRNGQSLRLTGATLVPATNGTDWTLSLGNHVSTGGRYRLQIAASSAGIVDLAGNALPDDRAVPTTTLIHDFTIDTTPPAAAFAGLRAVTNVALDTLGLSFNRPVTGVDLADLVLSRNGVAVGRLDTLAGVSLTPAGGFASSYTIGGLAPFTGLAGRYVLQLVASGSGIVDASGNRLVAPATTTWTVDLTPPTATLGPISPIVSGAISAVAVGFSELVSGVDAGDFELTRDGVTVPLAGVTLRAATTTGSNFQLSNLGPLTAVPGTYTLAPRSANTGILDAAGNLLAVGAPLTWRNVGTTVPGSLTGAFGAVVPNPRTVPLSTVPLGFSAAVTGVGPEDFRLTRTAGGVTTSVPTTGLVVTGSAVAWSVGGLSPLTQDAGDYVLRLVAAGSGIRTTAGVPLRSDVVVSWRTDATPAAPTATITLDQPASEAAAYDSATITFSKGVTGVNLSAFVLVRGTIPVSLTGSSLTALSATTYRISGFAPIVTATTTYELRLVATGSGIVGTDGSTLRADASVSWTQFLTSVRAAFFGLDRVTTAPVAAARLRFSESVRGVDVTDFELTVDANDGLGPQVVALRGVTVTGSGTSWTVTNLAGLQAGPGRYTLRLKRANGDILTNGGAGLDEDAAVEWTVA